MVMWVSKSLGHGFRVGTTIRTRPTQAQLKILDNAKFIENIQKRFREAFTDYLLQNGYYVADMHDLAGAEIEDDVYNPVKTSLDEFKDVMRLIQDGGNLTEKRKERLLKSVYGIEDLLTSKNTLKKLKQKYDQLSPVSILAIPGISIIVAAFVFSQDFSGLQFPNVVKWGIWSITTFIVGYIILKERTKRKEEKEKLVQEIEKSAKFIIGKINLGNSAKFNDCTTKQNNSVSNKEETDWLMRICCFIILLWIIIVLFS